jgi:hypothetical protein
MDVREMEVERAEDHVCWQVLVLAQLNFVFYCEGASILLMSVGRCWH